MNQEHLKQFTIAVLHDSYYCTFEYLLTGHHKRPECFNNAGDVSNLLAHATNLKTSWLNITMLISCLYTMCGTEIADKVLSDDEVLKQFEKLEKDFGLNFAEHVKKARGCQLKVERQDANHTEP